MQLHQLQPKTRRKSEKRLGRSGQSGKTSGHGTKGQKGRAGAGVRPGFAGGDNRTWQLFPKLRGASHKPGNKSPHKKHRFFQLRHASSQVVNLSDLNVFENGATISPETLKEKGMIERVKGGVKVLSSGDLKKKLTFKGVTFSKAAQAKIEKAGSTVAA
jgi:large subunit ribosomal protein L15